MLKDYNNDLMTARFPRKKGIVKKGTLAINVVETTPVVWEGSLYRFEWVRNAQWGNKGGVERKEGAYRFVNMETGAATPEFAPDHSFGCCYAENGTMYVHGTRGPGGGNILDVFISKDLVTWESRKILEFPEDIMLFNTSVCKGPDGYIMAIEIGGENPIVGKPFTIVFAKSSDLINWEMLPMEKHIYAQDRYTACPSIRYYDGYYYMVYLESAPCHRWITYIVRSKDLCEFELGIKNPFMIFDDNDKTVQDPEKFTPQQLDYIENAVDCNCSDVDFCDHNGKTVILYSWGNQFGKEFLAEAEYDGTLEELLKSHFAD
ncbi:MAG: hypothetical protein IKV97_05420 [Clostridia bacterium]|nr:hypothetical protein [Clostridia bacterium]